MEGNATRLGFGRSLDHPYSKGFSNLRSISYIVIIGVVRLQKADHATVGEGEAVDRVCKASFGDVAVISRF